MFASIISKLDRLNNVKYKNIYKRQNPLKKINTLLDKRKSLVLHLFVSNILLNTPVEVLFFFSFFFHGNRAADHVRNKLLKIFIQVLPR